MRAFCVKCRETRECEDDKTRQFINRRQVPMLQGPCNVCGKLMNTFLKRDPNAPSVPRRKKHSGVNPFGAANMSCHAKARAAVARLKAQRANDGITAPIPPPPPETHLPHSPAHPQSQSPEEQEALHPPQPPHPESGLCSPPVPDCIAQSMTVFH